MKGALVVVDAADKVTSAPRVQLRLPNCDTVSVCALTLLRLCYAVSMGNMCQNSTAALRLMGGLQMHLTHVFIVISAEGVEMRVCACL